MKKATVSKLSFLSVMSLYLVYLGTAEISPALATLAQHFTGKNVTWISTVPSLFLVIGSLLAGAVLGKRIHFRSLIILAYSAQQTVPKRHNRKSDHRYLFTICCWNSVFDPFPIPKNNRNTSSQNRLRPAMPEQGLPFGSPC